MENSIMSESERYLVAVTVNDLQEEALDRLGRELTEDEIHSARKAFEWGMSFPIDITYQTIFEDIR